MISRHTDLLTGEQQILKQLCASAAPAELVGHQGGLLPAPGLPIACAQKNFGRAVPAIAASPNNERRTTGLSTIEDQRDRRIGQGTERIGAAIEDQRDRRIGQAYWSVGERIRKNQNHPSEQRIGQGTPRFGLSLFAPDDGTAPAFYFHGSGLSRPSATSSRQCCEGLLDILPKRLCRSEPSYV